MRTHLTTLTGPKAAVLALALASGVAIAGLDVNRAQASPGARTACTECHDAGSTVTAVPSTATPAPGALYTVAIAAPSGGGGARSGYWISDSGGVTVTSSAKLASASMTASLTAPSAAGAYTYTVWATTDFPGSTNHTTFTITVAASPTTPPTTPPPTPSPSATPMSTPSATPSSTPSATPTSTTPPTTTPAPRPAAPRVARLTPARGRVGATVTIVGKGFARSGVVSFAAVRARVTSWSATRIVVKVPRLAARRQPLTVTPRGVRRSNAVMFTVLRRR